MLIPADTPIIVDACVLMVGVGENDPLYSFERMREIYLVPLLEYFNSIYVHRVVLEELDEPRRNLVLSYVGQSVTIVDETPQDLANPLYIMAKDEIANHKLINYAEDPLHPGPQRNAGEVYSLAYATAHGIAYFSSRDFAAVTAAKTSINCRQVRIVGFETILTIAFLRHTQQKEVDPGRFKAYGKAIKALYKEFCHGCRLGKTLPATFKEYMETLL